MGAVRRLLFRATLKPEPDMYAGTRSIEAAETMHVHERNLRLEYTPDEFEAFTSDMSTSHARWNGEDCTPDASTEWLSVTKLAASPGVTPTRFEIEESEYPTLPETTIHVHYRNLRLEFSHAEWEAFSAGIAAARREWTG